MTDLLGNGEALVYAIDEAINQAGISKKKLIILMHMAVRPNKMIFMKQQLLKKYLGNMHIE